MKAEVVIVVSFCHVGKIQVARGVYEGEQGRTVTMVMKNSA